MILNTDRCGRRNTLPSRLDAKSPDTNCRPSLTADRTAAVATKPFVTISRRVTLG